MAVESDSMRARALQEIANAPVPAVVARVVIEILNGKLSVTEAVDAATETLRELAAADRVSVTSTVVPPDEEHRWAKLGDRVWLKEWANGKARGSVRDARDTGPEEALSLPWLSQQARRDEVVVLPDTAALIGPATQDRHELERDGVRAMVAAQIAFAGVTYGSIGCGRATPGTWPDEVVVTVRVLCAALGSRLSAERDRAILAHALLRGDHAREAQQEFFAALGHELRTPLAAIVGTAEAMSDEAGEMFEPTSAPDRNEAATGARSVETVMEFAAGIAQDSKVVLRAGEQLLAVVNDLLRTGQELGGGVEVQPVPVIDAVEDVFHWLSTFARTSNVALVSEVAASPVVATTPASLRQVLTNLVRNAIAYNHPGGSVRLTASESVDDTGVPRIRVTVHDTGCGLTAEQQHEVFKPFVRFADGIPGTGLGLSLSRTLAERDGGLMGVESREGAGSSFWVDLPAYSWP